MGRDPHSRAESILTGTAGVEGGYIRSATADDTGKESVTHVVEVLDEVGEISPASYEILRQDRY